MSEQFGERTFTTFEVARLCGVFHTTVINWVNKGKLKARVTPGGHRRIPLSQLVPFMKKYDMPVPTDIDDPHGRILILDEGGLERQAEKAFAKRKDRYSVHFASNPVHALVHVGRRPPDLFVIDLTTPAMDGLQICRFLKADPLTRDIKIIALSGRKLTGPQQEALAKSADLILQKPVEPDALLAGADRLLV